MKKICFVTTISSTLNAFVLETAKYLYEHGGFNITFICNYDSEFEKKLPKYINYIPVTMKRGIHFSGIISFFSLKKIFKNEKFDLVQYSTPNASFYSSLAAKITKIPIRLYCQWGILYVGFKGLKRKVFKFIEKVICKFSTNIQPDSKSNLIFSINEELYKADKGEVIWNGSASGVNFKKFDINKKNTWRSNIRQRYNINSNVIVFGYVGRINRDKGINELLKSFKLLLEKHRDVKLMIVGGEENDEKIDKNIYTWSKKCANIIYCGSTNVVEEYYSAMDVFILPSYREGFGTTVIEAEAMGLPVIVTNIPGPIDAMKENVTGLVVNKGSSGELHDAMVELLLNDKMRKEFSKNALIFSKNNFDFNTLKKLILDNRNSLFERFNPSN